MDCQSIGSSAQTTLVAVRKRIGKLFPSVIQVFYEGSIKWNLRWNMISSNFYSSCSHSHCFLRLALLHGLYLLFECGDKDQKLNQYWFIWIYGELGWSYTLVLVRSCEYYDWKQQFVGLVSIQLSGNYDESPHKTWDAQWTEEYHAHIATIDAGSKYFLDPAEAPCVVLIRVFIFSNAFHHRQFSATVFNRTKNSRKQFLVFFFLKKKNSKFLFIKLKLNLDISA